MNYKFIWPLAFTVLLAGCAKKDNPEQNAPEAAKQENVGETHEVGNNALSDEAKKAAEAYVGQGTPTALFFFADWCPACRQFKPTLEEVEAQYPDIKVVRLNVDEQKEITKTFKISSIPSLFLFDKDGEFLESTTGGLLADKLKEKFDKINTGEVIASNKAE